MQSWLACHFLLFLKLRVKIQNVIKIDFGLFLYFFVVIQGVGGGFRVIKLHERGQTKYYTIVYMLKNRKNWRIPYKICTFASKLDNGQSTILGKYKKKLP
ncbi:MAG: hypothetical protein RIR11_2536 [Bacteroidota bacterium]